MMVRQSITVDDRGRFWLSALAILTIAAAVRLIGLGDKPFWLDEVFTVIRSSLPLSGVIANSFRHHHIPSFFLLEHGLIGMGLGAGPFSMRLIPAFAGAASAPVLFAIAWSLGGRAAAWLAGLLLALAPLQVGFAQEARSYTMMILFILIALWGLIQLSLAPEHAARRFRDPASARGAWFAYGVGTLAALLTLGDALPWLITANIAMFVALLPKTRLRRRFLANWFTVQAAIVVVAAPGYIAIARAVHDHVMRSFAWIPPLSLHAGWADLASLYGLRDATMVTMRLLPTPLLILAPGMATLAVIGIIRMRRSPAQLAILLLAFLGLPATLVLVSLIHPVLLPRYLLWSAAAFFVLAAFGVEVIPARWRPAAVAAIGILLVANLLPYYRAETKPRWDLAAKILAARAAPGDLLLVSDGATPAMLNFNIHPGELDQAAFQTTRHVDRAAATLAAGHHVFAVYGPAGQGKPPDERQFFKQADALGNLSLIHI